MRRSLIAHGVLAAVLLGLTPLSLSAGVYSVSPLDILGFIAGGSIDSTLSTVIRLRLLETLAAISVGVLLSASGLALQSILNNPLASPATLGVAQAAATGVAIILILSGSFRQWVTVPATSPYILPLVAFACALLQLLLIMSLAHRLGLSGRAIILAAIAMSFGYHALLSLLQYMWMNELQVAALVFWFFGDLSKPDTTEVLLMLLASLTVALYTIYRSIDLDLIVLGDDVALSSGVNPRRLRAEMVVASSLAAAMAVCFTGVVPFVGLIAPHMARLILGRVSHRHLCLSSTIIGAILLLSADIAGRTVLRPTVLPAGLCTSLIGVPLFITLILLRGREL